MLNGLPQMQCDQTVYLVDPDEAVRDSVRVLLNSFDIRVEAYPDGATFIHKAAATACGCALIESRLPDIEGLDLLSRLRDIGNKLPVLLLASSRDDRLARKAVAAGAAGVIYKPLLNEQLLEQLASVLRPASPVRRI